MYETIVILTDDSMLDVTLGVQFSLVSVVREEDWRISFMDEVFKKKFLKVFHNKLEMGAGRKVHNELQGEPGEVLGQLSSTW